MNLDCSQWTANVEKKILPFNGSKCRFLFATTVKSLFSWAHKEGKLSGLDLKVGQDKDPRNSRPSGGPWLDWKRRTSLVWSQQNSSKITDRCINRGCCRKAGIRWWRKTDESFHMLAEDVMEELFTDESDIDSVSLHGVDEWLSEYDASKHFYIFS